MTTSKTFRFSRHLRLSQSSAFSTYYCSWNNIDEQNIFFLFYNEKLHKLLSHPCCKSLKTSLKESILQVNVTFPIIGWYYFFH